MKPCTCGLLVHFRILRRDSRFILKVSQRFVLFNRVSHGAVLDNLLGQKGSMLLDSGNSHVLSYSLRYFLALSKFDVMGSFAKDVTLC